MAGADELTPGAGVLSLPVSVIPPTSLSRWASSGDPPATACRTSFAKA